MFEAKFVDKIKTRTLFPIRYLFENRAVCEIMCRKYCRAGQATDDNMAHPLCMLDN